MFLFCVALSLIVTGVLLPVEDIIISYLPKFDEPANPYTGPEAGSEADRKSPLPGTTGNGIADGLPPPPAAGGDSSIGTVVPKFMACPTDASLCCNGSSLNCGLRVDQMMFAVSSSDWPATESIHFEYLSNN